MLDFREEFKNLQFNEAIILELEDTELVERILPSQAISSASKKDIRKMSRVNLQKIVDKFTEFVAIEYQKHPKKQKYLGRMRFITDTGKIVEYPIKSLTKDSYDKIIKNKEEGRGRDTSMDKANNKLRVEVGYGEWITINLDNVLGLIFKGKVFSLEDISRQDLDSETQESTIMRFVNNQARTKTKIINSLIPVLKEFNFSKIPDETDEEKEKRKALKSIRSMSTVTKYIAQSKKEKAMDDTKDSYSVTVNGYNPKDDLLQVEVKVNLQEVLSNFGYDNLTLGKVPDGFTKLEDWREKVQSIKDEISEVFTANGFNCKVGTAWINCIVEG